MACHTDLDTSTSRLRDPELPWLLSEWMEDISDRNKSTATAHAKRMGIMHGWYFFDHFPVQEVFKLIEPLAFKLYEFLRVRYRAATGDSTNVATPEQDFAEFLGYFEETIKELRDKVPVIPRKRAREEDRADGGGGHAAKRAKAEYCDKAY
jgi:hypothetical protein